MEKLICSALLESAWSDRSLETGKAANSLFL
jgi:hypothetical protein